MTAVSRLDPDLLDSAADRLQEAAQTGTPCRPVRDQLPVDLEAGYAVQQILTARALFAGREIVGRKVDQPDLGVLFDDMAVADGATVDVDRLLQPRIEAEIAMVLGEDLGRDDLSPERVRAAVDSVVVALEIVDSRIAGWDISIVDTVADNASSGLFVLGRAAVPLGGLDLSQVRMSMREEDQEVSSGTGADCLGDPLTALTWLAVAARDLGAPLRAGDVVLSGALGPMVPVRPGATYVADVTGLGSVTVHFSGGIGQ
jgi:2-keto-4-pentenoate hydratase